jgi:hypothetical protein
MTCDGEAQAPTRRSDGPRQHASPRRATACRLLPQPVVPTRGPDRRVEVSGRCRGAVVCSQGRVREVRRARAEHRRAAELERATDGREADRKTMAVNVASGSRTFTIAWRAALATFVILVVLTSFGVFLGVATRISRIAASATMTCARILERAADAAEPDRQGAALIGDTGNRRRAAGCPKWTTKG